MSLRKRMELTKKVVLDAMKYLEVNEYRSIESEVNNAVKSFIKDKGQHCVGSYNSTWHCIIDLDESITILKVATRYEFNSEESRDE